MVHVSRQEEEVRETPEASASVGVHLLYLATHPMISLMFSLSRHMLYFLVGSGMVIHSHSLPSVELALSGMAFTQNRTAAARHGQSFSHFTYYHLPRSCSLNYGAHPRTCPCAQKFTATGGCLS